MISSAAYLIAFIISSIQFNGVQGSSNELWTQSSRVLGQMKDLELQTKLNQRNVKKLSQWSMSTAMTDLWCQLNKIAILESNNNHSANNPNVNNNTTIEINAIFICGAFLPSENYNDLLFKIINEISRKSNQLFSLRIAVIPFTTFSQFLFFFLFSPQVIQSVIKLLNQRKSISSGNQALLNNKQMPIIKAEDVWIMGHSAGGYGAVDLATKYMKGCISFAAIRETHHHISRNPFLYIAAERDGFLPITLFAKLLHDQFHNSSPIATTLTTNGHKSNNNNIRDNVKTSHDSQSTPSQLDFLSPNETVLLLAKGINHLQFGNGQSSPGIDKTHRNDLLPDENMALEKAHETISDMTVDFLLLHEMKRSANEMQSNLSNTNTFSNNNNQLAIYLQQAETKLIQQRKDTYEYLKPVIASLNSMSDINLVNEWQQYMTSFLPVSSKSQIDKIHFEAQDSPSAQAFLFSKPSISVSSVNQQQGIQQKQNTQKKRKQNVLMTSTFYRMSCVENILSYTGKKLSIHKECSHIGSILSVKCISTSRLHHLITGEYVSTLATDSASSNNNQISSSNNILSKSNATSTGGNNASLNLTTTITQVYKSNNSYKSSVMKRPSAAEFNEQTMIKALNMVPKEVKEEYLKNGRKLVFTPDLLVFVPPIWLITPVIVRNNANTQATMDNINIDSGSKSSSSTVNHSVSFQSLSNFPTRSSTFSSPIVLTDISHDNDDDIVSGIGKLSKRYQGMHYVKLISLSFALEWIYVCSRR